MNRIIKTVQKYYPSNNSWSRAGIDLMVAVWEAKAVYMPSVDAYYIIGGETLAGVTGEVQSMNTALYSAGRTLSAPYIMPSPREAGALLLSPNGSRLWYFGGADTTLTATYTVYEFNPFTTLWKQLDGMPFSTCAMGAVRASDGLYYIYGGGPNDQNLDPGSATGYYLDPFNGLWHPMPLMDQSTKYFGAAATPDGRIWAIGGGNGNIRGEVQSLQVFSFSATAPSTVKTGEPFLVNVTIATISQPAVFYRGEANIIGADGRTYGDVNFSSGTAGPFSFEMRIPQTVPAGNYRIDIFSMKVFYSDTDSAALPAKYLTISVTTQPPLSEQISRMQSQIAELNADLNTTAALTQAQINTSNAQTLGELNNLTAQNAALQARMNDLIARLNASNGQTQGNLNDLGNQTSDLQSSVNSKADGVLVYVLFGMIIVTIALLALVLIMVRREDLGLGG